MFLFFLKKKKKKRKIWHGYKKNLGTKSQKSGWIHIKRTKVEVVFFFFLWDFEWVLTKSWWSQPSLLPCLAKTCSKKNEFPPIINFILIQVNSGGLFLVFRLSFIPSSYYFFLLTKYMFIGIYIFQQKAQTANAT